MIQDLLKINPQNANSKFDGIQHVLQYEGHRGPADVQFVLKYGQVPSRYTQSNFDPDLILKSIQSGILKTLTLIHHASSVESEFQIDQIVLENTDVSCYLYLSHTPANGGTYELRASFLVEKSKEFYAFFRPGIEATFKSRNINNWRSTKNSHERSIQRFRLSARQHRL
jgi:hypothetical protein